jgi:hypothetical protein
MERSNHAQRLPNLYANVVYLLVQPLRELSRGSKNVCAGPCADRLRFCESFWRYLWVVPVLEFLRLPLLVYSSLTSEIVWRGRRLHINPDCTTNIVAEHVEERSE